MTSNPERYQAIKIYPLISRNKKFMRFRKFSMCGDGIREMPPTLPLHPHKPIGGRQDEAGERPGGLKITSTLGGNDSVSPRRHGALKYERYDEPRLPLFPRRRSAVPVSRRHLVPRWCISANLRSLALPLSFLPASPLVFPSSLSPPVFSRTVFLVSKDSPLSHPRLFLLFPILVVPKGYLERQGEVRRGTRWSKVYLGPLDLIGAI